MDIKDFILITGGILIALVVGHGFWIAWRAKREPLRMDIVPDLIPEDVDEMQRLRGELPNGGARVVKSDVASDVANSGPSATERQQSLELELSAPTLTDEAADKPADKTTEKVSFDRPKKLRARVHQTASIEPTTDSSSQPVSEPGPIVSDAQPLVAQRPNVREVELASQEIHSEPRKTASTKPQGFKNQALKRQVQQQQRLQKEQRSQKEQRPQKEPQPEPSAVVEELLIINVLAAKGKRFDGEGLVAALRSQGLRYGDMNIFHRIDPATKAKLYSVANAVEPGTFDLSDLAAMRSPGMTFFLQLPGPDDAISMFDDMLQAARNVALDLGGELRDEELSVLTGQSTEHMRQRIADFARRRLSKRA